MWHKNERPASQEAKHSARELLPRAGYRSDVVEWKDHLEEACELLEQPVTQFMHT